MPITTATEVRYYHQKLIFFKVFLNQPCLKIGRLPVLKMATFCSHSVEATIAPCTTVLKHCQPRTSNTSNCAFRKKSRSCFGVHLPGACHLLALSCITAWLSKPPMYYMFTTDYRPLLVPCRRILLSLRHLLFTRQFCKEKLSFFAFNSKINTNLVVDFFKSFCTNVPWLNAVFKSH